MLSENGITRTNILNEINRSSHGKLEQYAPTIIAASKQDPEFVAKLIAWDFVHGQIKDSKLALPVISLGVLEFPEELAENSLAHLAMQPPRELLKAFRFAIESRIQRKRRKAIEKMIHRYLRHRESDLGKWTRSVVRNRRDMKTLYALTHCPIPAWANKILFHQAGDTHYTADSAYLNGSVFADIASLRRMGTDQVAATIQKWHLSPLVANGAMTGSAAKRDASKVVQASMDQMSDTELITHAASLEKKGLRNDPALKERFRQKVAKAVKSNKATLKTSVAAEEVEDESLKAMLKALQERQIQAQKDAGRGIDGNWLVIADKSGSQTPSIELGKSVAAAITKFVSGKVWLVFCDTSISGFEVTGMTLDEIKERTKYVRAAGGTSYGVGLQWASKHDIDGIAIIGDGAENSQPIFAPTLVAYRQAAKKDPPVYLFKTASTEPSSNCRQFKSYMDLQGVAFTEFDISHGQVDYYAIPNLVQQMRADRFSLIDQVMAVPLLTLDQVFSVVGRAGA